MEEEPAKEMQKNEPLPLFLAFYTYGEMWVYYIINPCGFCPLVILHLPLTPLVHVALAFPKFPVACAGSFIRE